MPIPVELRKSIDILPHGLIGRVEDMGTVPMTLDARLGIDLGMAIAPNVVADIDDHDLPARYGQAFGDRSPEETGTNYQHIRQPMTLSAWLCDDRFQGRPLVRY